MLNFYSHYAFKEPEVRMISSPMGEKTYFKKLSFNDSKFKDKSKVTFKQDKDSKGTMLKYYSLNKLDK